MATSVATITGKVLIQIGDDAPVEVGTVEIPIYAGTERPKATRGREIATATVHICAPCGQCTDADHCADNCPKRTR